MRTVLLCASAVSLLCLSGCDGPRDRERDRDRDERRGGNGSVQNDLGNGHYDGGAASSHQTRVRADLATIEQAIDMYRLENMRYPTAQEGLNALVPRYLRRLPADPWNSAYVYVAPGPNGTVYEIASLGADKTRGGSGENADITN